MGHHVEVVGDGQEAIDVLERRAGEFDLVVLDLLLPRRSGTEVFHVLRALRPDLPVILSSGNVEEALLDAGMQAGVAADAGQALDASRELQEAVHARARRDSRAQAVAVVRGGRGGGVVVSPIRPPEGRSGARMRRHTIAVLPGDGIGAEVVAQGLRVLDASSQREGFEVDRKVYPYGADHYLATRRDAARVGASRRWAGPRRSSSARSATRASSRAARVRHHRGAALRASTST